MVSKKCARQSLDILAWPLLREPSRGLLVYKEVWILKQRLPTKMQLDIGNKPTLRCAYVTSINVHQKSMTSMCHGFLCALSKGLESYTIVYSVVTYGPIQVTENSMLTRILFLRVQSLNKLVNLKMNEYLVPIFSTRGTVVP